MFGQVIDALESGWNNLKVRLLFLHLHFHFIFHCKTHKSRVNSWNGKTVIRWTGGDDSTGNELQSTYNGVSDADYFKKATATWKDLMESRRGTN